MENEFGDSRLAKLFAYWRGKRGNHRAPPRRNIKPMEIPALLPIVHLIDVHEDPLAFRHRLVGAELVERLGRDGIGCRRVGGSLGMVIVGKALRYRNAGSPARGGAASASEFGVQRT